MTIFAEPKKKEERNDGYLAERLVTRQVVNDGGEQALDGGEVTALGRDLKVDFGDLDNGSVCLDELAVQVGLGRDLAGINGASDSDGVGLLQLVGSVAAVGAVKGHDDHLTEVRHASE